MPTNAHLDTAVLYGAGTTEGIVAIERCSDTEMEIFRRVGDDTVATKAPLRPFLWVRNQTAPNVEPLEGNLYFNVLATCAGWEEFQQTRKALAEAKTPYFAWTDATQHYLAASGETFFKGMDFSLLRRLQIDIETDTAEGYDFPNPRRDSIAAIALSDTTGWEEILIINDDLTEKAALTRLTELIAVRDPDVIEGHNIFNFDLPYLSTRAKAHKTPLAWGRNGSSIASRSSRLQIAERTIQYERYTAYGRHIVDTLVLAQHYDVATREMESLNLKTVARHLGVAEPDRVYIEGEKIAAAYRAGDPRFLQYALQDVRETRAVSAILSQSYFYQAQIFPFTYQDVVLRGNATKIDALFLREYLRRRHALPDLTQPKPFAGGETEAFEIGVFRNVWHCDATSLYPSIILAFDIAPRTDALGIFAGLLAQLRSFRLAAKAEAQRARDEGAASKTREGSDVLARAEALQRTFKILINSFYGYLGFAQGHFADFAAASEVAARGRQILGMMMDWLREQGALVIEADTDGIYFQPPADATQETLRTGMNAALPEGIEVEFDSTYRAMVSYKAKNYALLAHDGSMSVTGAALKSRGMEPYLRDYLSEYLHHLLNDRLDAAARLADDTLTRLRSRGIPIEKLARTETLQDSIESYKRKIAASSRNRSAAYEVAIRSDRDYRAGDQVRYYIAGADKKPVAYNTAKSLSQYDPSHPDENLIHYAQKLQDLAKKFTELLPPTAAKNENDLFTLE